MINTQFGKDLITAIALFIMVCAAASMGGCCNPDVRTGAQVLSREHSATRAKVSPIALKKATQAVTVKVAPIKSSRVIDPEVEPLVILKPVLPMVTERSWSVCMEYGWCPWLTSQKGHGGVSSGHRGHK